MARIVRIIRVLRFFVGLRQILMSLVGCAYTLLWASGCIIFLMYLFSIILLQGAMFAGSADSVQSMRTHYSDLGTTMFTLLLAISNGIQWEVLADDLGKVSPLFRLLFAWYVIFVMFGIMNVVNGVFVERTAELKNTDRDLAVHQELGKSTTFIRELRALFEMNGMTECTEITYEDFEANLERDDVQMYLQTHNVEVSEARELFLLLDADQSGTLSMDEFVYGCQRLKGSVKNFDVVRICDQVTAIASKVREHKDKTEANHRAMRNYLDRISAEVHEMHIDIRSRMDTEA